MTAAAHAERVVFPRDDELAGELADPTAERILETLKTLEG